MCAFVNGDEKTDEDDIYILQQTAEIFITRKNLLSKNKFFENRIAVIFTTAVAVCFISAFTVLVLTGFFNSNNDSLNTAVTPSDAIFLTIKAADKTQTEAIKNTTEKAIKPPKETAAKKPPRTEQATNKKTLLPEPQVKSGWFTLDSSSETVLKAMGQPDNIKSYTKGSGQNIFHYT